MEPLMIQAIARYALLSLSLLAAGQTHAAALPAVPAPFVKLVPTEFPNGLKLVDLARVRDGGPPWRILDIPAGQEGVPARQEKVSVADGVRAMYAFPGTPYFANTKIEFSVPGHYEHDKATVLDGLTHMCAGMQADVLAYLGAHPDVRAKVDGVAVKGKDYVEFESASIHGIDYARCTQNALHLRGSVPAMLHIFVPQREVIVTAYLLQQKQSKFQTIDEFLQMEREFINGYIDFLRRP
jgi:hypothetical protein